MKNVLFAGCGVALITPFKDGKVDFDAFDRQLDRLLNAGVDAYFPCGTTGEPATLTDDE
ncbi:MAG: 4-hydroxy-tetrahydrodipicolinate synthase, partial [Clostridiales bacterium]|nr:4-hydroxy-tetrahydrodipicolinate synthase [Clostridiales bacterium]